MIAFLLFYKASAAVVVLLCVASLLCMIALASIKLWRMHKIGWPGCPSRFETKLEKVTDIMLTHGVFFGLFILFIKIAFGL